MNGVARELLKLGWDHQRHSAEPPRSVCCRAAGNGKRFAIARAMHFDSDLILP